MTSKLKLDWEKFKSLVHYICAKAEDPACLGAVKLNKTLWYSDSIHYMLHGAPITGEDYVKRQNGPVPKHVLTAVDQLVAEKKVMRGKVDYFGFIKNEYIAIQAADTSRFTAEEIDIVNDAFKYVCYDNTARSISEETHGVIWQMARMGELIPYQTVFASSVGEVDESDVTWAQEKLQGEITEALARTLKLSEAIRKGCQRSAPTKDIDVMAWVIWQRDRCFSCVIGAAWLGATDGNEEEWFHSPAMSTQFKTLFGLSNDVLQDTQYRYEHMGETREQIADWLEAQGF